MSNNSRNIVITIAVVLAAILIFTGAVFAQNMNTGSSSYGGVNSQESYCGSETAKCNGDCSNCDEECTGDCASYDGNCTGGCPGYNGKCSSSYDKCGSGDAYKGRYDNEGCRQNCLQ